MVGRIATGEVEDTRKDPAKAYHAEGGKKGGKARAERLTPEQRSEPAMAAGVSKALWSLEDIANRIEASRPAPSKRGPYKKAAAEISN
jgi:hypothetical protein